MVPKHPAGEFWGQILQLQAIVGVGAEDLGRPVHERRLGHGRYLEAGHMVLHGDGPAVPMRLCRILQMHTAVRCGAVRCGALLPLSRKSEWLLAR